MAQGGKVLLIFYSLNPTASEREMIKDGAEDGK